MLLVAQVADNKNNEIPNGSTMVLLNDQDEPGILNPLILLTIRGKTATLGNL